MAKLETKLTIEGIDSGEYSSAFPLKTLEMSDNYSSSTSIKEQLDNSDTFIKIVATGNSITGNKGNAGARLQNAKLIVIKNCGKTAVEIMTETNEYGSSDQIRDNAMYQSMIISPNDYIVLPNQRIVSYSALESAGNHASHDNVTPSSNLYLASGALTTEAFTDDNDTTITIDDGSGGTAANLFRIGDLIRIENEVMRITAINSEVLTVDRGLYGTAKADHNNNDEVRFTLFNENADFDKFSKVQTDSSGKYTGSNLILNAAQRSTTSYSRGIVRGSLALKFYSKGYQELGMSGMTSSTSTGLTAGTTYKFNITVDGGSTFSNLTFTTDTSNVNFGGTNGVISKIQDALNTQYNTFGSNLYEKKVIVELIDGDLRFTSQNRTSASAVVLAAPTSGTTVFGAGRFPAIANVEASVSASLPDDTIRDENYVALPNDVFAYDNGEGKISGVASGTIDYEKSSITLNSGPAEAEFVVSAQYNSVHSGGINATTNFENGILAVYGRSCNSKVNGEVEIIGFM